MDDILFLMDIAVIQSQGNHGTTPDCDTPSFSGIGSREQAWAKNNVSVGSVYHYDNTTDSDDYWHYPSNPQPTWSGLYTAYPPCLPECCITCAGSAGPANDGRIKPDLAFYGDNILTPSWGTHWQGNDVYTCHFHSTSAATPIVAGYFGLMFQMWHQGVFPGFGGGPTAFDDRPHMTTAKALMVNTAFQYPLPPPHDITRNAQGWGRPDVKKLYDLRNNMLIVNESILLLPLQSIQITVPATPTMPLKATLIYSDRKGNPGSTIDRINKLTLKVASQTGGGVFYGNNGLATSNWSAAGGTADNINTTENVFIQTPDNGNYTITITASEINLDGHVETPGLDADFALVVSGVSTGSPARRGPDWNLDGDIDSNDFFAFLNSYFNGEADFDGDGVTSASDLLAFLDALFLG